MEGNLEYKIGELTGKVSGIGRDISEIKTFMERYDERINSLETSRSQSTGAVAVLSTFISFVMMIVGGIIQKEIGRWIK